jgi:hypothetical protein
MNGNILSRKISVQFLIIILFKYIPVPYRENTSIISLPQRGRAGMGAKKSKSLIPIFIFGRWLHADAMRVYSEKN